MGHRPRNGRIPSAAPRTGPIRRPGRRRGCSRHPSGKGGASPVRRARGRRSRSGAGRASTRNPRGRRRSRRPRGRYPRSARFACRWRVPSTSAWAGTAHPGTAPAPRNLRPPDTRDRKSLPRGSALRARRIRRRGCRAGKSPNRVGRFDSRARSTAPPGSPRRGHNLAGPPRKVPYEGGKRSWPGRRRRPCRRIACEPGRRSVRHGTPRSACKGSPLPGRTRRDDRFRAACCRPTEARPPEEAGPWLPCYHIDGNWRPALRAFC